MIAATATDTNFFPVLKNLFPDPNRGITLVTHQHKIRDMDGGLFF